MNPRGYVTGKIHTGVRVKGKLQYKHVLIHRYILNPPANMVIDHINGNKLDNRKCNLRVVTTHQNNMNRSKGVKGSSQYKGVSYIASRKRWMAGIQVNNKSINLGFYKSEVNAAQAYNFAAEKYFGEFAKYNIYQQ